MNKLRIATWNLERPKQNSWKKNPARLEKIAEVNADIWVLTETSTAISIPEYHCVASPPVDGYHWEGENSTSIWSRWPIIDEVTTHDSEATVCVEVDSPIGPIIVYGTIITYANDGVGEGYRRWEKHRQSIRDHAEDWRLLKKKFPNHHFCFAGDFNQSRDGSGWYEDKDAVEMLTASLADLGLACVTEDDLRLKGLLTTRATVDHICLSHPMSSSVVTMGAWEGSSSSVKMSDHNGVFVDVML